MNQSIKIAFERFWGHIITKLKNYATLENLNQKADVDHFHFYDELKDKPDLFTKDRVYKDTILSSIDMSYGNSTITNGIITAEFEQYEDTCEHVIEIDYNDDVYGCFKGGKYYKITINNIEHVSLCVMVDVDFYWFDIKNVNLNGVSVDFMIGFFLDGSSLTVILLYNNWDDTPPSSTTHTISIQECVEIIDEQHIPDAAAYVGPVGTVQSTLRSDLPENWLLCDGSEVENGTYPELENMLDDCFNSMFYDTEFSVTLPIDTLKVYNAFYENGTAILTYDHALTSYIAHRNAGSSVWEINESPISLGYYDKIRWLKDKYVIIDQSFYFGSAVSTLYSSPDLKTWNTFYITHDNITTTSVYLRDIIYANGNYMLCAERQASGNSHTQWIGFSTSLEGTYDFGGSSYTNKSFTEDDPHTMTICHANNYFFAVYPYSVEKYYVWCVDSNSPTHDEMTGSKMTLDTSSDKIGYYGHSNIVYANGKYYFGRKSRLYSFLPGGTVFSHVISAPEGSYYSIENLWVDEDTDNIFFDNYFYIGMISGIRENKPVINSTKYTVNDNVSSEMTVTAWGTPKQQRIGDNGLFMARYLKTQHVMDETVQSYQLNFYQFRGNYAKQLPLVNNGNVKTYVRAY